MGLIGSNWASHHFDSGPIGSERPPPQAHFRRGKGVSICRAGGKRRGVNRSAEAVEVEVKVENSVCSSLIGIGKRRAKSRRQEGSGLYSCDS